MARGGSSWTTTWRGTALLAGLLYYPGHTTGDPADTILAASPIALGPDKNHRLVLRLSNAAEIMPEGEFQQQVGKAP